MFTVVHELLVFSISNTKNFDKSKNEILIKLPFKSWGFYFLAHVHVYVEFIFLCIFVTRCAKED